jgi:glutamine amidotransferase
MVIIVDYGMGNLGSITNMLKKVGHEAVVSSNPQEILHATKLILPGIGAFDAGISSLIKRGFVEILNHKAVNLKTPILGICLGMQLMTNTSEEGTQMGFGWIDAYTVKFKFKDDQGGLKIPHMSWNTVRRCSASPLLEGLDENSRFYFVHSYHVVCRNSKDELLKTRYGYEFVSAVQKENICGVQFHPEKSHRFGMRLLKNFVENL